MASWAVVKGFGPLFFPKSQARASGSPGVCPGISLRRDDHDAPSCKDGPDQLLEMLPFELPQKAGARLLEELLRARYDGNKELETKSMQNDGPKSP